jgi:hypothetical protein
MTENLNENQFEASYIGSPSKLEKRDNIRLAYECIQHKSRAYKNDSEKWAYASKVEDLMMRLLRFTRSEIKERLENHYNEMKDELKKIENSNIDPDKKEREALKLRFEYAHPVHEHNIKLLPMSGIIVRDVEGELDVSNEEILTVIRGGLRKDDTNIWLNR